MTQPASPKLGVAIVTFHSADVIGACLDSLFASQDAALRVVLTDNASSDDTVAIVRSWAERQRGNDPAFTFAERPADDAVRCDAMLTLLRSEFNGGYGHGVNAGLRALLDDPALSLFWVLNPDCVVPPATAAAYVRAGADGAFALMSGRTAYCEDPDRIQSDGGRVSRWTGVCSSINAGLPRSTAAMPDTATIDFFTGGNVVASRRFIERTGLMPEDYFLYYEEVDWAMRRGDLPLRLAREALVLHHVGTSIGSGTDSRLASPLSNYFNFRNRVRFLRRYRAWAIPFALAHAAAKSAQLALQGAHTEATAALFGAFGGPPPASVRARIAPGRARLLAFGKP